MSMENRFPLDVVKTRIQSTEPYLASVKDVRIASPMSIVPRQPHPFRTIYSTVINSYKSEGIVVFSAGLGPTLLRSIPVNMVCFFVFEAVVGALR